MSTIPPNWLGSIIQTQGAKARAAGDKQRENVAETERGAEGNFADKLQDVIENSDRDSQVYSDAEGGGSQGRPFEGAAPDQKPTDADADADSAAGGLDLQA
jgi:hypothetical protein